MSAADPEAAPALDASSKLPDPRSGGRVGTVALGQYALSRVIGEGGMGTVYEARHTRLGRRFAVKFLRSDLICDRKLLARFEQEAVTAGALESEHIAAVVDFSADEDGTPCLVMEYVDGRDLAHVLATEGPLLVARAVGIAEQICRGLRVAHTAGIVHRDLKPSNLIVTRGSDGRDRVKIVDFGIAKVQKPRQAQDDTTTGAALGTPYYMSPEQARGDKCIDQRADIYALGVILYELLTQKKPHPGDTYNAIIYHILSKQPVPLRDLRPEVPEGLAQVVEAAMATDPEARPADAAELERALGAYRAPALGAHEATLRSELTPAPGSSVSSNARRGVVALAFFAGAAMTSALSWLPSAGPEAAVQPEPMGAAAAVAEARPSPSAGAPTNSVARPVTESQPRPGPPESSTSPPASPRIKKAAERAPKARAAPSAVRPPGDRFELNNPYE